jgi:CubicO group peptidase (beta-lactamase class C family)
MAESGVPGIALTIAVEGAIVYSEGFGYSDLENSVLVDPSKTGFRVASVAKPMTLMAIGKLHDEGKIDLDSPVGEYLPELASLRYPITIRQLAGHLGGIRHYEGDEFWSNKEYESVRDGLAIFMGNPISHEPGTKFLYSSYGINVLGAVIEAVSGQQFVDVMNDKVFRPLGMHNTVADDPSAIVSRRARPYSLSDGNVVNSRAVNNTYKWPSGGFLSTTENLVEFGLAHLQGKALSEETLATFWTPQRTSDGGDVLVYDGEEMGYGMGWMVRRDTEGRTVIGHLGRAVGGSTEFGVYAEPGLVYAMSTNGDFVSERFRATAYEIASIFMPD